MSLSTALPLAAMAALEAFGFVVLPGPVPIAQLEVVADAYDAEVGAGRTSIRVSAS